MAAPLEDYRGKITTESHCVAIALARAQGVDKQEIIRDALHKWALSHMRAATLMQRCLRAKGVTGAPEGDAGAGEGSAGQGLEWQDE